LNLTDVRIQHLSKEGRIVTNKQLCWSQLKQGDSYMAKGMVQQGNNNKKKLTTKEKKQKKKDKANAATTTKAKTP